MREFGHDHSAKVGVTVADTVPTIRNFGNAPVIETVLSIQFKPIPGFTIPHFPVPLRKPETEINRSLFTLQLLRQGLLGNMDAGLSVIQ